MNYWKRNLPVVRIFDLWNLYHPISEQVGYVFRKKGGQLGKKEGIHYHSVMYIAKHAFSKFTSHSATLNQFHFITFAIRTQNVLRPEPVQVAELVVAVQNGHAPYQSHHYKVGGIVFGLKKIRVEIEVHEHGTRKNYRASLVWQYNSHHVAKAPLQGRDIVSSRKYKLKLS